VPVLAKLVVDLEWFSLLAATAVSDWMWECTYCPDLRFLDLRTQTKIKNPMTASPTTPPT